MNARHGPSGRDSGVAPALLMAHPPLSSPTGQRAFDDVSWKENFRSPTSDPRQRRPVRELEETTVPRRSCETFPPRVHAPGREGVGKPPLTVDQILAWADAHKEQTGTWPDHKSGGVSNAMGENWQALDYALRRGHRGQGGGSSLETLLAEHRGVVPPGGRRRPRKPHRTPLTVEQVLKWADEHYERTGRWPTASSGLIPDTDGESCRPPCGSVWNADAADFLVASRS